MEPPDGPRNRAPAPAISKRTLPPVGAALHNLDLRRALVAYLAARISEWALWSAVLVYAYERGGRTIAGFVSVALFVPGVLVAPLSGAAADGRRPNRVLTMVYALQAVALAAAAVAGYRHGPLLTVVVPAAGALVALSFVAPCWSVVVPGLVRSAGELTASNLLAGYCESAGVLLGPLVASGLIALGGPPLVLAACAAFALIGTLATWPLLRLDASGLDEPTARSPHGRIGALAQSIRALGHRRGALQLLVVLGGQYLLIGAMDLILVLLATETLHLGASGPGLLGASFGVGAVLGGAASTVLVARPRLAPLLMLTVVGISGSLVLVAAVPTLAVALIVLPVAGLSRALLDLTGRMLLQRAAPQEVLASIFATMESLMLVACALGSIVAQVVIAVSGLRAAILTVASMLFLILVLTVRRLLDIDASADAPVVEIRLLRGIPLFAPLPGPALEGVARAAVHVAARAGTPLIVEGEPADRYLAIVSGEVAVTKQGQRLRIMTRGQGLGEIALLADVPRTATATAHTDVELLTIERAAFLTAVTGHDASRQAAWAVARAWLAEPPA